MAGTLHGLSAIIRRRGEMPLQQADPAGEKHTPDNRLQRPYNRQMAKELDDLERKVLCRTSEGRWQHLERASFASLLGVFSKPMGHQRDFRDQDFLTKRCKWTGGRMEELAGWRIAFYNGRYFPPLCPQRQQQG